MPFGHWLEGPQTQNLKGSQSDHCSIVQLIYLGKSFETYIHVTEEVLESQGFSAKKGISIRITHLVEKQTNRTNKNDSLASEWHWSSVFPRKAFIR